MHAGYPGSGFPALPTAKVRHYRNRRRTTGTVVGLLAVAAVIAVAVTGFWMPGFLPSKQVDVTAAQDGVRQVLADAANGYGATDVTEVHCNNGANPAIESGANFTCEATVNGAKRQVKVTFADDAGTFWVGGLS